MAVFVGCRTMTFPAAPWVKIVEVLHLFRCYENRHAFTDRSFFTHMFVHIEIPTHRTFNRPNSQFTLVSADRLSFRAIKKLPRGMLIRNFTSVFADRSSFSAGLPLKMSIRNYTTVFTDPPYFRAKGLHLHCLRPKETR